MNQPNRSSRRIDWIDVIIGVIGIIVGILLIIGGIYLLVNPTLSMIALGTLVGFWFIFEGIGTILDGQIIRLFSPRLWIVQLIFSIIMIAAGVMLLGDWLQGGLTAATLIGIMLLLNGIMRGGLRFQWRLASLNPLRAASCDIASGSSPCIS